MKKINVIYIVGALLAGLLLGYMLSPGSGRENDRHEHSEEEAATQIWTCSMHPQIRQPEPGNCPICGMELIPAEGDDTGLRETQFALSENAMALANIRTAVVGTAPGRSSTLFLSGKIRANEEANVVQASYFSGRIENLYVNTTGETIRKGQRLAMIYSPELIAAQQELLSALSLKSSQPALYEAVRNKLKLWKLSDSQINGIEASGKVEEYVPVFANVSGTITEKMVQEGDYVMQGQALLRITDLSTVWAVFDAYEQQLPFLERGQQIKITSNASPSRVIKGKISFIDPILNSGTRTVAVRAVLDNREGLFKPGMFVKGTIADTATPGEQNITIPASAVMWTGERSLVYVRPNSAEPVFEMREVLLGPASGNDSIPVMEGLMAGDEIVINGTFTVDAAAQLQGSRSMMNREGNEFQASGHNHGSTAGVPGNAMVQATGQGRLNEILAPYFEMKDAFVTGDPKSASVAAARLSNALEGLPDTGDDAIAQGEAQGMKYLSEIAASGDLEVQRAKFVLLNRYFINMVKKMGHSDKTVYIQHCPMANSNNGANWLSLEREIRNPYLGDAMLTCGSITDSIR